MEIPIYLESSIRPLIHRDIRLQEYMKDPTHDLKYRISPISLESSIQLLMKIGDYDKQGKLIHKFFRYIPYSRSIFEDEDFLQNSVKLKDKIMDNLLTPTVPLYMIEIIVDNFQEDLNFYKEFVNSLVFNMNLINYKRNNYRTVDNLDDYINSQIKIIHYSKKELGVPKLKYTKQLTDLYSAGSWTDNPFTSFINYYQIIEYFFNEIPDNRLFKMVQKQITSPLFSYNRKNDIIQLAKQIYDVRKNDMNELNSLEIVLDYFLDIKMIKKLLTDDEIKYYSKSLPKFISGDKKEVCFNINNFDENRYENIKCLARRIYSIRNALVHNKENSQNNYNPQYHYKMLLKEVPLIKAIASLIIIKSGHTF
ncbi:hypothetical protein [Limosilactobacillus reuteri]|nr:hypothetical protein [Limosilactobacillus reuteri]MCT3199308.1 hypothetical protein [Limosilactobacillus reuteri]